MLSILSIAAGLTVIQKQTTTSAPVAPAVLAVGGALISSTIFTAATYFGCAWGVGCSYGSADTPLQRFSFFVPLAAVVQLLACAAALVDRRPGKSGKLFPLIGGAGCIIALLAFSAIAGQWYIATRAFGGTLAKRTGYGVVLIGHGAWAAIVSMVLGDSEPVDLHKGLDA